MQLIRVPFTLVTLALELDRLHGTYRRRIRMGRGCLVDRLTWIVNGENIQLGNHVKISAFSTLIAGRHAEIQIGEYTIVGPSVLICAVNHGFRREGVPIRYQQWSDKVENSIVIEDNVWVGGHAVVLPGVRIGRGSVIAAGSVVRTSVPAGTVYTEKRQGRIGNTASRKEGQGVGCEEVNERSPQQDPHG